MSHHGKTSIPKHEDRVLADAMSLFCYERGLLGMAERATQIIDLPRVEWKGRTLYTIRCYGTRGKGPHNCNVAESLLWSLIDFSGYRCVYHAGD